MSFKVEKRKKIWNPEIRISTSNTGSVLIYIIVVMMVFALLGAAMVAMFSSATMMSTGTPNYARQARHLAESGMRYAVSELRADYSPGVIQALNDTEYTLSGSGKFDLNVFGKWFEASADYTGTGNIQLTVPEGQIVGDDLFSIPAGAYLVNLESYRDALFFGGGAAKESFVTQIDSAPVLAQGASSLEIAPTDSFLATASKNHRMLLSVKPSADQTIGAGGNLTVSYQNIDDWNFFPRENGSFYVVKSGGVMNRYYYSSLDEVSSSVFSLTGLTGTEFPLAVSQASDLVILSERNHSIGATGSAGGGGAGGNLDIAADFQPNINDPQEIPPPAPGALPADLSPSDFASDDTATPESASGAVTVDTTVGSEKINLGGNVASASGAAFFGGDVSIGGFDVCSGGKCGFFDGIRAFFVFDYTGSGDGFTFTVASGSENGLDAYGATGGALGYAGISPTGKQIKKPKIAVEFDTYTNSGHNDPDDAAWSHRDMMQFVYWGSTAADPDDDNTHDTGGFDTTPKWEFTNPSGAILSKPAVDSTDGTIYIGSRDDNVYAINPDGSEKWRFDSGDDVYSSPALEAGGTIYVGSDVGGGALYALDPDTGATISSGTWPVTTASNVRSAPVVDSSGNIYFGTWVSDNNLYAVLPDGSAKAGWPSAKSGLTSSPYPQMDGRVAIDEANDAVYVSTMFSGNIGYLSIRDLSGSPKSWSPVNLLGPSFSSPVVAEDGTVYIASDGASNIAHLFAIEPDGTLKWRFDFTPTNPRSTPSIGPDGTIYIGNDDNKLYAINPDGTVKWTYLTGGDVRGEPLVHDDGTIWFGSRDQQLYVVDSEGRLLHSFGLGSDISESDPNGGSYPWDNWIYSPSPAQGPDGTVYMGADDGDFFAFAPTCQPQNIKSRYYSFDDLPGEYTISDADDWMESGPWAVRVEIERSNTLNTRNKYEYTLKAWIRQCQETDCSDILGSYFQDTRIEYAAKAPHLTQTVELCSTEHTKLDTFIFGFTQGTGAAIQTIDITDTQLGFMRPGDFVITQDDDWP